MGHLKILFSAAIMLLATSVARSEEYSLPQANGPTNSSGAPSSDATAQLVQIEKRQDADAARAAQETPIVASPTVRPTSEERRSAIAVEKAREAYLLALERQRHAKVVLTVRRRAAIAPRAAAAPPHQPHAAPNVRPELVVAQQQGGCRTINCPRYVLLGVGF